MRRILIANVTRVTGDSQQRENYERNMIFLYYSKTII